MSKITFDENGQILIPLALNQQLGLQNYDWLKVNVKGDHAVLTPCREIDSIMIEELVHQGILIDV